MLQKEEAQKEKEEMKMSRAEDLVPAAGEAGGLLPQLPARRDGGAAGPRCAAAGLKDVQKEAQVLQKEEAQREKDLLKNERLAKDAANAEAAQRAERKRQAFLERNAKTEEKAKIEDKMRRRHGGGSRTLIHKCPEIH